MQINNCQPILGLIKYCKLITGFISLTCKLFLGRDTLNIRFPAPAGELSALRSVRNDIVWEEDCSSIGDPGTGSGNDCIYFEGSPQPDRLCEEWNDAVIPHNPETPPNPLSSRIERGILCLKHKISLCSTLRSKWQSVKRKCTAPQKGFPSPLIADRNDVKWVKKLKTNFGFCFMGKSSHS